MPTPVTLTGISEAFSAAELESLVRAAAKIVCCGSDDLSSRQRELAQRAYALTQSQDTAPSSEVVSSEVVTSAGVDEAAAQPETGCGRDAAIRVSNQGPVPNSGDASDLIIQAFLDLSTAHLSEMTCRELGTYEGVTAYQTAYGWLMYASDDADELADEGDWPAELLPIVKVARAAGCTYILFDADAQTTDRLPTFNW